MDRYDGIIFKGRYCPPIRGGDPAVDELEELTGKIEEASVKMAATLAQLDANPDGAELDSIKTALAEQQQTVNALAAEKAEREREIEVKALRKGFEDLTERVKGIREPRKFEYATGGGRGDDAYESGQHSWCADYYSWKKHGNTDALARMRSVKGAKALNEGTTTAGGYLVVPQYLQDQIVALRRASAPLRGFVTVIPTNSSSVIIPTETGAMTVAWTAENATKTASDKTFGQVTVNIFTLAGISKISNQLVEDSAPSVDAIVRNDVGRGLAIEEDRAMINGSGSGQPTGILNTSGVTVTAASAQTAISILDDILAAIGRLQAAYFGQPDAIVMAPRTWSKLMGAKDTTNRYLSIGTTVGNQQMMLPGLPNPTGSAPGGTTLFGIPLIIDANMPIAQTVGMNANRSSIIVGVLREAWLFERDGVTIDVSDQAGTSWESNQTWFRGEERVGFTAARNTSSMQVISDVGP